jgi:hypothetical protein
MKMAPKRHLLHYIRYTHLYLGVFIAPALFFFAFTGALQTFSFHETTKGSSYKPPAWIATLAQIHKKQTTTIPVKKLPPPATANADDLTHPARKHNPSATSSTSQPPTASPTQSPSSSNPSPVASANPSPVASANPSPVASSNPSPATPSKPHNPLPLKFFFLLVSLGLFTSTLSGLYMSYRYSRNRKLITALLIAGIILPIALIFL